MAGSCSRMRSFQQAADSFHISAFMVKHLASLATLNLASSCTSPRICKATCKQHQRPPIFKAALHHAAPCLARHRIAWAPDEAARAQCDPEVAFHQVQLHPQCLRLGPQSAEVVQRPCTNTRTQTYHCLLVMSQFRQGTSAKRAMSHSILKRKALRSAGTTSVVRREARLLPSAIQRDEKSQPDSAAEAMSRKRHSLSTCPPPR